jgi:hypothetical protein
MAAFSLMGTAALIVGGLPTAVGVALFLSGRGMFRRAKVQPDQDIDHRSPD